MLKVSSRSNEKRYEICFKLTIKTPERLNVVVLVSLMLPLNKFRKLLQCFYCYFEKVSVFYFSSEKFKASFMTVHHVILGYEYILVHKNCFLLSINHLSRINNIDVLRVLINHF